jgi:peptidoglycan/xylan/chitin deacetylase (PgdA/CDA1 family)
VSACGVQKTNGRSNVLLTIDDYPDDAGTAHGEVMIEVADWAKRDGVMMEAFPIKQKVDAWQKQTRTDLVAEIRARGTYASNHTLTHAQLTKLAAQDATKEIEQGVTSTYFRPPFGDYNPQIKEEAETRGYRLCTWNIDTNDWRRAPDGSLPGPQELVQRVHDQLARIPDGTPVVILGHYYTNYPKALAGIVAEVRRMGNRVCPAPKDPTTETVPYPIC